ncbi:hypothetical protein [Helcococcus bovis]|uniref:hypothetical protein n=1 Tax=Helcococcus bovis TaxID=3153252 RepID=UPI0038B78A67
MKNKLNINNIIKSYLQSPRTTKIEEYYKIFDTKTMEELKLEIYEYKAEKEIKTLTNIINTILVFSILFFYAYIFIYLQNLIKTSYVKNPRQTTIIFNGITYLTLAITTTFIILFFLIKRKKFNKILRIIILKDYLKTRRKNEKIETKQLSNIYKNIYNCDEEL